MTLSEYNTRTVLDVIKKIRGSYPNGFTADEIKANCKLCMSQIFMILTHLSKNRRLRYERKPYRSETKQRSVKRFYFVVDEENKQSIAGEYVSSASIKRVKKELINDKGQGFTATELAKRCGYTRQYAMAVLRRLKLQCVADFRSVPNKNGKYKQRYWFLTEEENNG